MYNGSLKVVLVLGGKYYDIPTCETHVAAYKARLTSPMQIAGLPTSGMIFKNTSDQQYYVLIAEGLDNDYKPRFVQLAMPATSTSPGVLYANDNTYTSYMNLIKPSITGLYYPNVNVNTNPGILSNLFFNTSSDTVASRVINIGRQG